MKPSTSPIRFIKEATKTFLFVVLSLTTFSQQTNLASDSSVVSQDTVKPNNKRDVYVVTIRTMDNVTLKNWFYRINDDRIYLYRSYKKQSQTAGDKIPSFDIEQINTISVQRRSGLKGTLIGLGIGTLTGVIIGFASGDDPVAPDVWQSFIDPWTQLPSFRLTNNGNSPALTAGQKALGYAIVLGATGAITGFIIAKLKKEFLIGGKKENYMNARGELMSRSLGH